ncbi:hypothetical protein O3M35_012193 [Rhynocoris fuscipes]|uniref:Amine oxidase domain-containing protein n=1 Tax=Rhynocoris fuscipes TaxID=488301 RepID=A0AAW1CRI8_9HEMI
MNKLKSIYNSKHFANLIMRNVKYCTESPPPMKPLFRNPTIKCTKEGPPQLLDLTDPTCPCASLSESFPKVAIIGAGIAGLSAAMRLINCGFEDITIFEATNRCGGRIYTTWMDDAVIELGANKIEGACIGNPAYTLACMEGLFENRPPERVHDNFKDITSDGRILDQSIAEDMLIQQLLCDLRKLLKRGCTAPDVSLLHYLMLHTDQVLLTFPSSMKYDTERILYGIIHSLKTKFGTELENISCFGYGKLPKLPGGDIIIPSGFINLLAPLIRDIPSNYIRFCKPIKEVQWSDGKPNVVLTTEDEECFTADFAIVTLPLGVLKQCHHTMFVPTLPNVKVEAINALGFGHINNIYLDYREPWWSHNDGHIRIAWHKDEVHKWPVWIRGISTIRKVPGSEHVIAVTLAGEEAKLSEDMTSEEIAVDFTNFIRIFMNNRTIKFPNNVIASKWSNNSNYYGAKSYLKLGSNIGNIKDLSGSGMNISCIPAILFAGEHTHPIYFGTVHGAILSGLREANRIIEYTQQMLTCAYPKKEESPCQQEDACAQEC